MIGKRERRKKKEERIEKRNPRIFGEQSDKKLWKILVYKTIVSETRISYQDKHYTIQSYPCESNRTILSLIVCKSERRE
jgi:hypothetical protein